MGVVIFLCSSGLSFGLIIMEGGGGGGGYFGSGTHFLSQDVPYQCL